MEQEAFESSTDWERSIGLPPWKLHYREKGGSRHAVCDILTGKCEVHEDRVNPHRDPLGHIVRDTPHIVLAIGMGIWLLHRKSKPWKLFL